eukprot:gene32401-biopygen8651
MTTNIQFTNIGKLDRSNGAVWRSWMRVLFDAHGLSHLISDRLIKKGGWLYTASVRTLEYADPSRRTGAPAPTVQVPAASWAEELYPAASRHQVLSTSRSPGGVGDGSGSRAGAGGGSADPPEQRSSPPSGESEVESIADPADDDNADANRAKATVRAASSILRDAAGIPLPPDSPPDSRPDSARATKADLDAKFVAYITAAFEADPSNAASILTLLGKAKKPDGSDSELAKIKKGTAFMRAHISPHLLPEFEFYETPRQIYDTVLGWDLDRRFSTIPVLRRQLQDLRMSPLEPPMDFFHRAKVLIQQLDSVGEYISEYDGVSRMIAAAVHERFAPLRAHFSMVRAEDLTFQDVVNRFEALKVSNMALPPDHLYFPPCMRKSKTPIPSYAMHEHTPPYGGRGTVGEELQLEVEADAARAGLEAEVEVEVTSPRKGKATSSLPAGSFTLSCAASCLLVLLVPLLALILLHRPVPLRSTRRFAHSWCFGQLEFPSLPGLLNYGTSVLDIPEMTRCEGKAVRQSFPQSTREVHAPLQLVHLDIMGPFSTKGLRGEYYTLVLVDQYSGYAAVVPIARKSMAPTVIQTILIQRLKEEMQTKEDLIGGADTAVNSDPDLDEDDALQVSPPLVVVDRPGEHNMVLRTRPGADRANRSEVGEPGTVHPPDPIHSTQRTDAIIPPRLHSGSLVDVGGAMTDCPVLDNPLFEPDTQPLAGSLPIMTSPIDCAVGVEAKRMDEYGVAGSIGPVHSFGSYSPGRDIPGWGLPAGLLSTGAPVPLDVLGAPGESEYSLSPNSSGALTPVSPAPSSPLTTAMFGHLPLAPSESLGPRRSARLAAQGGDIPILSATTLDIRSDPAASPSSSSHHPIPAFITHSTELDYATAMAPDNLEREQWRLAMKEELASLEAHHTWLLTPRTNQKVLDTRWIFTKKLGTNGEVVRYKARYVVKGFMQRPGLEYSDVYAPVTSKTTLRVLLAAVAARNMHIKQVDIKTAFLLGELEPELGLFCSQPEGFEVKGEGLWHYVLTYVDDFLICVQNLSLYRALLKAMEDAGWTYKELGTPEQFLSLDMQVTVDDKERCTQIILSQHSDITDLCWEIFDFTTAKETYSTPMVSGDFTSDAVKSKLLPNNKLYISLIGSFIYLSTCTRPDIAFAVSTLSRFSANPTEAHWKAAKRLLIYLRDHRYLKICYKSGAGSELTVFSDSSFGECKLSRRSQTGVAILSAGSLISWSSKRQITPAVSTGEAEYQALATTAREAIWLKYLRADMGFPSSVVTIQCDSTGAISWTGDWKLEPKAKRIDVIHHYIQCLVDDGRVKVVYVNTKENKADPFTKGLAPGPFWDHVKMHGMVTYKDPISPSKA